MAEAIVTRAGRTTGPRATRQHGDCHESGSYYGPPCDTSTWRFSRERGRTTGPRGTRQHGDHFAPETRPADAVEQKVDGVIGADDHNRIQYTGNRHFVFTAVQPHHVKYLDGYCHDDECDAHRHQHRRHARIIHRPLSIHIAAFASDIHDDGGVTDDEDHSGEERRQEGTQYLRHINKKIAEILTALAPPSAALVDVDEHPHDVQVSSDQRAASDDDAGGHSSSGEEKMGFVRYEDDDEALDGHQHDDPRTELRKDARDE